MDVRKQRENLFYPLADVLDMGFDVRYVDSIEGACNAKGYRPVAIPNPLGDLAQLKAQHIRVTESTMSINNMVAGVALQLSKEMHMVVFYDRPADVIMTVIVESKDALHKFFRRKFNYKAELDRLTKYCKVLRLVVFDQDSKLWVQIDDPDGSLKRIAAGIKDVSIDKLIKDCLQSA